MTNKTSSLLGALGGAVLGAAAAKLWYETRPAITVVPEKDRADLAGEALPAVCAHRGLPGLCAENSLAGAAAAAALGVQELEFDVRATADQKLIVCHDPDISRVTGRAGRVADFTLAELQTMKLNSGDPAGWNVPFATPDELFALLGGRVLLNIHIYEAGKNGWVVKRLRDLVKRQRLERSVYFSARGEALDQAFALARDIPRCALDPLDGSDIVKAATDHLCVRCQFLSDRVDAGALARAKELGIVTNLCAADTPDQAQKFLAMGFDVILSNRSDLVLGTVLAAR